MSFSTHSASPLFGVRVWLSGAIPLDATSDCQKSIGQFVEEFATRIFSAGGHIVHGSHPTFTPILVEVAKKHIAAGGRKDCLTLAVSRFWSKEPNKVPLEDWRQVCMVYETPEAAAGPSARNDSLHILRQWMSDRCDAFVCVGGKWWHEVAGQAGVPVEASLAMERGLPCFLLGGLGGAAQDYVQNHPEVIRSLRNGFDHDENRRFAIEENVGTLVGTICDQLSRLPLVRGRVSDGISFRILVLDGGGIKGAFTASVLATLEEAIGIPITKHFDLIAGTSTGGILAVGLGMGLTPMEMLTFYRTRGPVVFPITRLHKKWWYAVKHWFLPKHSQATLRTELTEAYFPKGRAKKVFGQSECRLLVPAYDAVSGVCHVFRTPHNPIVRGDKNADPVEVALATAAAPTYFRSATVKNLIANSAFFDGGVWANCPAMAAIIEAICYLNVSLDRIDILSIGTTEEPFTVKSLAKAGILRWGRSLISLLMSAQQDSAVEHARSLVGDPRFLRVNTMTMPGMYSLDNSSEIENLISLGHREASKAELLQQVKSRFLNGVEAMNWEAY